MIDFDPKIVAFCCDQSGYPAADMAGALKLGLPGNIEIVRVPCAGRIETVYLLKALEKGADGVLVFACHEKNCQFLTGNLRAKARLSYAHRMLDKIGLEKDRIEICHLATNSGVKLAEALHRKSEQLKKLGPNPGKCKFEGANSKWLKL
jgi:coenzyme F420-reducing hydrogenase delta subunit